jgi:hypothetical protein
LIKNEGVKVHFSEEDMGHKSIDLNAEISKYGEDRSCKLVLGY